MLESGLIIRSILEFGCSMHIIPKPNSTELRLVGDYKILNKMLTPDRCPLPNIHTAYEVLHGSQIFSTIDLKSAFYNVPVAPEDLHKTTVRFPEEAFAFTRILFGLSTIH